ncbi:MAG: hypothetical protein ACLGHC_04695 [Alphaproteobacteria bacterium]
MADEQKPVRFRSYSPRIDVHEEAQLVSEYGRVQDVILADISREGFRIKCNGTAVATGPAALRAQKYGDMAVEIRWVRGNEAGGIFLDSAPEIF